MNKSELGIIINKLIKLSRGVDPSTNIKQPNDIVINSRENQVLFKQIIELLSCVANQRNFNLKAHRKAPFFLSAEQIKTIELSEKPISISAFVCRINETIDYDHTKKLKATDVTTWLEKEGYLSRMYYEEDTSFRKLTDKSKEIDLMQEKRINSYGNEYYVILYSYKAQKFVLDHLSDICMNLLFQLFEE